MGAVKAAFHDTDIDILARILADSPNTPASLRRADTSDTRDFLASMSVSMSVSWNAALGTRCVYV